MDTIHHLFPYTGNPVPFLYTPTSLLPEHSVLTDVQQATGRNGQQWITCKSEGQGTKPQILMGNIVVLSSSTDNSATIGLGSQRPNGLYRCSSAQWQIQYFSLFLRNSGKYIRKLFTQMLNSATCTIRTYVQQHSIQYHRTKKCIISCTCSIT